ncbi:MAG TPA: hypothetical protein VH373_17540 [Jatrophihabitantaceae bacterium]|jgi:hypothetical protein
MGDKLGRVDGRLTGPDRARLQHVAHRLVLAGQPQDESGQCVTIERVDVSG